MRQITEYTLQELERKLLGDCGRLNVHSRQIIGEVLEAVIPISFEERMILLKQQVKHDLLENCGGHYSYRRNDSRAYPVSYNKILDLLRARTGKSKTELTNRDVFELLEEEHEERAKSKRRLSPQAYSLMRNYLEYLKLA
jgi:hypothetical protein